MTKDVRDAIVILRNCIEECNFDINAKGPDWHRAQGTLYGAIGHLAYPDRFIYPKTRRGTKGAPIVRR